jgi:hypothetical protein
MKMLEAGNKFWRIREMFGKIIFKALFTGIHLFSLRHCQMRAFTRKELSPAMSFRAFVAEGLSIDRRLRATR